MIMAKPQRRKAALPLDDQSGGGGQSAVLVEDPNYTCAIKIFQASPDAPRGVDFASAADFPPDRTVPGYLCQAARLLVGLTQQELHLMARVSKKSINDYENGFIAIRVALAERLVAALRGAGARFIAGEGYVGVIVSGRRTEAGVPAVPFGQGVQEAGIVSDPGPSGGSAKPRPARGRRGSQGD
ncbi:helix-turn-helix domain-containing protein [Methylorubrum populi]|jgi:DNA-binding XRE family transcriptional regulator|uniref:helix-turn-helix domain-containing protein n=1 Tax=Methylorubrum populi TaxID=223967 RepID=UPI001FCE8FE6|nr:helix-turn-helix transcriptional regulator [Methylorubrum populi]